MDPNRATASYFNVLFANAPGIAYKIDFGRFVSSIFGKNVLEFHQAKTLAPSSLGMNPASRFWALVGLKPCVVLLKAYIYRYRCVQRERESLFVYRERESLCLCIERESLCRPAGWLAGWQAGAHFCHWSLLILRFSKMSIKILNISKDV